MKAAHLRLVTGPRERKPYKRVSPPFSREEEARLRAAIRNARVAFGTWACLDAALRVGEGTARSAARGQTHVSGDLAVRLSRALGVSLESLYRPGLRVVPFPRVCPTCGRGDP